MLKQIEYNRLEVVEYAKIWAYKRNPKYINFDTMGGDCTNFASQCIFVGCNVMNYKPVFGWYYLNSYNRTASWSGVEYLYKFLIGNKQHGPYAEVVTREYVEIGDLIQFGKANGNFYHTPIICGFDGEEILVAAHSYDAFNKPLSSYSYQDIRFLHILGARK